MANDPTQSNQPVSLDMSTSVPLDSSSSGQTQQPQSAVGKAWDKANELAGKALSAAGLPTSISNIPEWFQHLTGTHPNSEPFWEPIKRAIQNPTQENIVGAVPFVRPSLCFDVQRCTEGRLHRSSRYAGRNIGGAEGG